MKTLPIAIVILAGWSIAGTGRCVGEEPLAEPAHEVVIVGGGVAGLSAAFFLMEQGVEDHSVLEMSDQKILARTLADLKRLFPRAALDITESQVHRVPEAFPVMGPGAYKRLMALDEANYGGVLLAGDYVIYPTLESAIDFGQQAAQRAARRLRAGSGSPGSPAPKRRSGG